jgi:predicted O-methyltransferase YrrM
MGRMALTYRCEPHVIDTVVERLKISGLVAHDAVFHHDAPSGLRREVAYRDYDFLLRLSRTAETETVSSGLHMLKREGFATEKATYDEHAFEQLRHEVRQKFTMPGTSITPVMERLLYMLGAVRRPQRIVGVGTYCGNALVWCVGSSCGQGRVYDTEKVYGIDIDPEATARAKENLSKLAHTNHIELMTEDGLTAVDRLKGPFDYLFLDVDSKDRGKKIYFDLLERLYDKLEIGAWVLAHDTTVPPFAEQLGEYLSFVRDTQSFQQSISFDIDPFGLELSIR